MHGGRIEAVHRLIVGVGRVVGTFVFGLFHLIHQIVFDIVTHIVDSGFRKQCSCKVTKNREQNKTNEFVFYAEME